MNHLRLSLLFALAFALLSGMSSVAHTSYAGAEWNTLNQEVTELNRAGEYDRAIMERNDI